MTPEESKAEFDVVYQTRLGMMCENREPTPEQKDIAFKEATETVARVQKQDEDDEPPE